MVYHPLFRQLNAMFSKFSYEHMLYQSMLSHQCRIVELIKHRHQKDHYTGSYIVHEWNGNGYISFKAHLTFAEKQERVV